MPLRLMKEGRETWRDCVIRVARQCDLEKECLAQFDEVMEAGVTPEETAAWDALYEWDCLEYVVERD